MKPSPLFFAQQHLSEEGIALYVDALKLGRLEDMPHDILDHVEHCGLCKAQIIELDSTLPQGIYDSISRHPFFDQKIHEPKVHFLYPAYKVAAVVATVTLVGAGYFYIISQNSNHSPASKTSSSVVEQSTNKQNDLKIAQPAEENKDKALLAENFVESPNLEDLVHGQFRSSSISAVSPVVGKVTSQPITFRWKNYDEPITLKIMNNKEMVVTTSKVDGNSLTLKENLNPGLYYWKLETEDELLFVGKFIVK